MLCIKDYSGLKRFTTILVSILGLKVMQFQQKFFQADLNFLGNLSLYFIPAFLLTKKCVWCVLFWCSYWSLIDWPQQGPVLPLGLQHPVLDISRLIGYIHLRMLICKLHQTPTQYLQLTTRFLIFLKIFIHRLKVKKFSCLKNCNTAVLVYQSKHSCSAFEKAEKLSLLNHRGNNYTLK